MCGFDVMHRHRALGVKRGRVTDQISLVNYMPSSRLIELCTP